MLKKAGVRCHVRMEGAPRTRLSEMIPVALGWALALGFYDLGVPGLGFMFFGLCGLGSLSPEA